MNIGGKVEVLVQGYIRLTAACLRHSRLLNLAAAYVFVDNVGVGSRGDNLKTQVLLS